MEWEGELYIENKTLSDQPVRLFVKHLPQFLLSFED
jgi:hypothetical protein